MKTNPADTFDWNCPICTGFIGEDRENVNIIYESESMIVALNPRWSPHLGRCAIIPKRHLGADGKYGLAKLPYSESVEAKKLSIAARNAIEKSFSHQGIMEREGQPLIDYIERPSEHPSGDLFPTYNGEAEFDGYVFPKYDGAGLKLNSMPAFKGQLNVILSSFPKARADFVMPYNLRSSIAEALKENFDYDSIKVA